ncbi:hypothetical protein AGMMS49573_10750 [Endomicrobiia bacterium]|nr:hypothetical protein AGMMS49573_10750 [Endomicrobiia bacterium]
MPEIKIAKQDTSLEILNTIDNISGTATATLETLEGVHSKQNTDSILLHNTNSIAVDTHIFAQENNELLKMLYGMVSGNTDGGDGFPSGLKRTSLPVPDGSTSGFAILVNTPS